MRLVYFARVREAIGRDSEDFDLPNDAKTVGDALTYLATQGPDYSAILTDRSRIRFALDQRMVGDDALLDGASELAIFPPVTGG